MVISPSAQRTSLINAEGFPPLIMFLSPGWSQDWDISDSELVSPWFGSANRLEILVSKPASAVGSVSWPPPGFAVNAAN
jgi:hypothetical protein